MLAFQHFDQHTALIIHVILIILFLVVVATLFQALFFLARDQGDSKRTVKVLTLRIGLSVMLFILVLVLWAVGLLKPVA